MTTTITNAWPRRALTAAGCALGFPSLLLLMSGCFGRQAAGPVVPPAKPADVSIIRSYGWDVDCDDPQAAWGPSDYQVLARSSRGFVIYTSEDATTSAQQYRSLERRESWYPAWVNAGQVVFGPQQNVERLDDGRVVPLVEGLTLVDLGAKPVNKQLCSVGFRPRVGSGFILAQSEDRILRIDEQGQVSEFGRGFYGEPQRGGEGVAWQETPVFETDWWTGQPVRSNLDIRWHPGQVDLLHGGVQPAWCANGALVATVLHGDPVPGRPWWIGGSDVELVPGPGKPARLIAPDARDGAPHPKEPLVAVTTRDDQIALVSSDGTLHSILCDGCCPHWSADGMRLLVQSHPASAMPAAPGASGRNHLTVYVLSMRPAPVTAAGAH